ncbi:MAG: Stp1/IreP family PP2C-type Ser/Thr phosphatase [Gammaproteobacteria bacterium]|nr:Stp1/IreP family PP2C-type Ser/Thr phosphatase [Gammaproteobacteria bacterium]
MEIIGRSDTGRVRQNNEDAWTQDSDLGVAVLADGMGGLDAGEVASDQALVAIMDHLRAAGQLDSGCISAAINAANRRVYELAQGDARLNNMGTTVVLWAALGGDRFVLGHVGDSRAYRINQLGLERLTRDHSVVQTMVDDGVLTEAQAHTAPNRNVITRAIGLAVSVEVEVAEYARAADDVFLLCSDGLSDMLGLEELTELCRGATRGRLAELAERLVQAANDAGGSDNITVVLLS